MCWVVDAGVAGVGVGVGEGAAVVVAERRAHQVRHRLPVPKVNLNRMGLGRAGQNFP